MGRILALPFALLWGRLHRSEMARRIGFRAIVLVGVLTIVAGAVGVILINNVVIGRTAELGRLDSERRELRRDNALLSAQAARQSSPARVSALARSRLKMAPSERMPTFVYLHPRSSRLTRAQRQQIRRRAAAREQREVARRAQVAQAQAQSSSASNVGGAQ
jgi:cell division protein FtsL